MPIHDPWLGRNVFFFVLMYFHKPCIAESPLGEMPGEMPRETDWSIHIPQKRDTTICPSVKDADSEGGTRLATLELIRGIRVS